MWYALKITSKNSNSNRTIKIRTSNLENLQVDIKFDNDKEKINNCFTDDSELLWRSQVLKIIRGI
ncbi:hypothetical protein OSC52_03590 [Clostridium pasteurianum]|uniref:hypothetical protein n=1 Tax=Clostridium pasteurianum TaxID=1501 RepID=UPI00226083AF|nr:hypothetical protein [Clostridium pasteurianum]UZW14937.1 hypothetical protein OSC52_03590 [Clostridium pasteurianum]